MITAIFILITASIQTVPTGAELYIDGFFLGSSPQVCSLESGRHLLEARSSGEIIIEDVFLAASGEDTVRLGPFFIGKSIYRNKSGAGPVLFPEFSDPFPYLAAGADGELTGYDKITHFGNEQFDLAMQLYYEKSCDEAFDAWRDLSCNSPPLADLCAFWGGMSLCCLGEYSSATIEFRHMLESFPESSKKGEALFNIGRCMTALGDFDGAARYFRRFLKDNKEHRSCEAAVRLLETAENEINARIK